MRVGEIGSSSGVNAPTLDGLNQVNNADPWMHRSVFMLCHTCMWWKAKAREDGSNGPLGRCRRHAPTISGYPATFGHDWCGDHKLDENK